MPGNSFFGQGSEDSEPIKREFISPDYTGAKERKFPGVDDDDDDEFDDHITDEDEDTEDKCLEEIVQKQDLLNQGMIKNTFEKQEPWKARTFINEQRPTIGGSMWGTQTTGPTYTPFGSPKPASSPNGGGLFGFTGSGSNNNNPDMKIDRTKKVVFCDFLDCIVETYQSNKVPGFIPRDIYDLVPRFDVWQKIAAFNPEVVYAIVTSNLITSTNGPEGWYAAISYFCSSLSAFLRIPYPSCQVLSQSVIGQKKEDLMLAVIDDPTRPINRKDIISIGIYSGVNGQSDKDSYAARVCNIDYIDLFTLLSMN